MKQLVLLGLVLLSVALTGAGPASAATPYSFQTVTSGERTFTVARPWNADAGTSPAGTYPVIVWANGWDNKEDPTDGYLGGLAAWAVDGPYVVVADRTGKPTEATVLATVQWIVAQDAVPGGEYEGRLETTNIGLAGHSQGASVVGDATLVKALYDITGVVQMNPPIGRGKKAATQDGPVFALGGEADIVCPPAWYERKTWPLIRQSGAGGIWAILDGGTHNDCWGGVDFAGFQGVTELFWQYTLNGQPAAGTALTTILDAPPWATQYSLTTTFTLE